MYNLMTKFEFSDWSNNSAYIINTTNGKVVDTVILHNDGVVATFSGKPLSHYGLSY